ncbi:mRNA interferase endoA [Peptococcaceae bacterium CEB3]|nr:mRNA interferase endoA [Peptococcaceae bacterium CEB3]
MSTGIQSGDVVLISLPPHEPKGHEQEGLRPAIIIAIPNGHVRYPVAIVVPVTSQTGNWTNQNPKLYIQIPQGTRGLPKLSVALIDQVRAIDVMRVTIFTIYS